MLTIEYLEIIHLITIYYLLSEYDNNHDAFKELWFLQDKVFKKKKGRKGAPLLS